MSPITLLIAESSESFSDELVDLFGRRKDFTIVGTCRSGLKLIDMVHELKPQAVLMNIVLEEMDGLSALRRLQKSASETAFIICAELYNDTCIRLAHRYEARYFLCRPVLNDTLPECILECVNATMPRPSHPFSTSDSDRAISDCLLNYGISSACDGYALLKNAVTAVLEDASLLNAMTKRLYVMLAERSGSSASRVERNIRTAIGRAYSRGMPGDWKSRPTNRDFIAAVVSHVRETLKSI